MKKYIPFLVLLFSVPGVSQTGDSFFEVLEEYSNVFLDKELQKVGTGVYKMKYPNNKLNYVIHVKDSVKHGKFISYNRDGNIVYKATFNKGKLNGNVKAYFDDKQLKYECSFNNGELLPGFKAYFSNGDIACVGTYDTIKNINLFTQYNRKGQIIGIAGYTLSNNKLSGTDKVFYSYNNDNDYQLKALKTYKNGEYHGEIKRYYENGQLSEFESYENGKKQGELKYFLENGTLILKQNYKDGIQSGEEIRYFNNGNLRYKSFYNIGIQSKEVSFYKNGKISREAVYNEDGTNYLSKDYFEDGQTEITSDDADPSISKEIRYFENGNMKLKSITNQIIKTNETSRYYEESGQLKSHSIWSDYEKYNRKLSGTIDTYYENGKIESKSQIKKGKTDGNYFHYYENGQLALEVIYNKGIRKTVIASFDINGKPTNNNTLKDGKGKIFLYDKDGRLSKEIIYDDYKVVDFTNHN